MSKIQRNEPCPCGSGKKYKKCCGASNVTEINPKFINNELNRLQQELISFAFKKYDKQIKQLFKMYANPFLQEEDETANIYNTGLTIWIIFNVPFIDKKQTIFDVFYKWNQSSLSLQTKNILAKWTDTVPAVYEVVSVNKDSKQVVTIQDISTDELYYIPFQEGDEFIKGSIIIGALVPYMNYHNFPVAMIKLYRHDKDALLQLMEQYPDDKGGIVEYFPAFLGEALTLGVEPDKWDNPIHEMVAQRFAKHMVNKDMEDDIILKGIELWNQYCKKEQPSFKRIEAYAAALDYLSQKTFLNETTITQGQIAKEYDASPVTVSTNVRKLANSLEDQVKGMGS
ncbi:YecA family protein [Aquibacillus sediminis]|uniref:YecA family protein n=1 Tax=Aquibacillus sediminis TaxID=2574734 RepID=UPI001107EF03|nr:SEC-C domain-containing protein [Aquibacillus sediminis]